MRRSLVLLAVLGAASLATAAPAPPPPPPPPWGVSTETAERVTPAERRAILPRSTTDVLAMRRPGCPPVATPLVPRACPDPMLRPQPFRCFPTAYWGLSPSFMPNVGLSLEVGGVYRRTPDTVWSWEAAFTWQPIDDETFIDDGNPAAGDWFQLQGGVKWASHPESRRHWTGRAGGVWCYSGDEPNLVEEKGHYFGAYVGVGFEADLTASLTMGPEIRGLLLLHESGRVEVIPQFVWHVLWNF